MVLKLRYKAPDNWEQAKCTMVQVTADYDPFFDDDFEDAMDFCNGSADGQVCPIRQECLLYALTNNERHGIWGGCTELTRKAMRKRWPLGRRTDPRPEWRWMTLSQALGKMDLVELILEPDDEDYDD